jgi:hypothetical protein
MQHNGLGYLKIVQKFYLSAELYKTLALRLGSYERMVAI